MPGCQIIVAKDGEVVIDKTYGKLTSGSASVNKQTLYDLASMTKTVATLAALMKSFDEGKWNLTDSIYHFIPQLEGMPLGCVTMEQLLYHRSGLKPSIDIYSFALDTATYKGKPLAWSYKEPYTVKISNGVYLNKNASLRSDLFSDTPSEKYHLPVAKGIWASDSARILLMEEIFKLNLKDKSYRYSDLNFCLLMQIQENITGKPMDVYLQDEIYGPLGMRNTGYQPSVSRDMSNIASTENDRGLRKQHLKGYVHDETAAFSGGVQGNAGLFSTAEDVVKLCETWLNGGEYAGTRIYTPETVELFTQARDKKSGRALGFDRLTTTKLKGASDNVYGHTGFTGTCFWIDPANNLVYIFLSNRVDPTRDNKSWSSKNPRMAVLSAVYNAMKK